MNSKKRFLAGIAGVQSGKTCLGCIWLISEILKGWDKGKDYSYLIAAPTYKILQQSTLRKWLELVPEWFGEYKEMKSVFELKDNRGIIYIRSTEDPDALEGMTLKAAWLDEAGQMNDRVWQVMQGRLAILHGRLLITTTPYTFNWVYHEILKGQENNKDIFVVTWESIDNPWFPKKEYDRQLKLAEGDPNLMAAFEKRYKGIFREIGGLVYQNWHEKYIYPTYPINQTFKEFIAGIDWGYTNPAAVEVIGISDEKPQFVVVDEWHEIGRVIEEIAAACLRLKQKYNIRIFYADPTRPDYIQELNNRRIPVMPADSDIPKGIANLQRKIKGEDLYITQNCYHLIDEMKTYHYPETSDGSFQEVPVNLNNHAVDSIRYAIATHVPLQIEIVEPIKPIWKDIKESIKPIPDEEDGAVEWYRDGEMETDIDI